MRDATYTFLLKLFQPQVCIFCPPFLSLKGWGGRVMSMCTVFIFPVQIEEALIGEAAIDWDLARRVLVLNGNQTVASLLGKHSSQTIFLFFRWNVYRDATSRYTCTVKNNTVHKRHLRKTKLKKTQIFFRVRRFNRFFPL